ncbi:protein SET-like [Leucoraja erinacea]|uniref:protein SET-like n=1 Tax=Leucoraja erinaceus TaxID=7782 RepID=UPI002453E69B|nr:protein SET-like [Leucoraja erinacea]
MQNLPRAAMSGGGGTGAKQRRLQLQTEGDKEREEEKAAPAAAAAAAAAMERCPGERGGPAAVAVEMERGPGGPAAVAGEMERGPGGPAAVAGATLRALGACQRRLLTLARRAGCEVLRVERRYGELRRPHLQRRGRLIERIPGFWVTAVSFYYYFFCICNVAFCICTVAFCICTVAFCLKPRLHACMHWCVHQNVSVQILSLCCMHLRVACICVLHASARRPVSQSTPIKWKPGMELTSEVKEPGTLVHHHGPPRSFFCWFSEHRNPTTDHIAEVLKDDMWPNPLQYFLVADSESGENGLEDSDEENGGDSVVIVDGDDEDDDIQEILEDDEGEGPNMPRLH